MYSLSRSNLTHLCLNLRLNLLLHLFNHCRSSHNLDLVDVAWVDGRDEGALESGGKPEMSVFQFALAAVLTASRKRRWSWCWQSSLPWQLAPQTTL